ncbi:unnamed protein product [Schistosoma mattheei]|uniref:Serpin domain-containing protein n=2 Tax=Schistosoma TaxID=6181 RepID=A0A183K651_9TREM|nr:unnamed protein product [Schistosoma curassoni]VDP68711.1 unnamed protein product [Schistosoma mattheei]
MVSFKPCHQTNIFIFRKQEDYIFSPVYLISEQFTQG